MAKVYVGTYKKYNEGSLFGEWLDLADYTDDESFYEACRELHKDERDPEFMFQDVEDNIFGDMISESHIDERVFELQNLIDEENIDEDAFEAYMEVRYLQDSMDADDIISDFKERYEGHFDSLDDFGYYWYENGCLEIPEHIVNYFDFERYGRDVAFDYSEMNGYYFRDL